jgi:hypothetical protein
MAHDVVGISSAGLLYVIAADGPALANEHGRIPWDYKANYKIDLLI